jgi:hypothetical protein
MNDGEPPFDLWEVDIRRAQPFQKNRHYLQSRVTETLGLLYADHFPYRQMATARGVRRSPIHEQLKARGAVFGEVAGWERANWFADEGQAGEYQYSWKRQNWFDNQKREHMAVREKVGLFDMTSFGKIRVEGRDALATCSGFAPTTWMSSRGGSSTPRCSTARRHRVRPHRDAAVRDGVPAGGAGCHAAARPQPGSGGISAASSW